MRNSARTRCLEVRGAVVITNNYTDNFSRLGIIFAYNYVMKSLYFVIFFPRFGQVIRTSKFTFRVMGIADKFIFYFFYPF